MEYTRLGRSGLSVSRLCLGTMNFGPLTSEPDAHAIMDAAHERGINFFDTSNTYGRHLGRGSTEEIVGRWFAQGNGRRERTVLATKLYGNMSDWPNDGKLSAQAQAAAARRNFVGLVSEQSIYNLLTRAVELEVLPAARHYGLGVLPWSPLHGGALGGVLRKERAGTRRAEGRAADAMREHRAQLEQYEDFAAVLGHEPGDIALAWLLRQPAVTAAIVGPRTMEQFDAAVRALDVALDDKALARLDELFPGHRTAPEDYAW